jgi:hypothetical protein
MEVPAKRLDFAGHWLCVEDSIGISLVQRWIVPVCDSADRHGCLFQVLKKLWRLFVEGRENCRARNKGINALSFQTIQSLNSTRRSIERDVHVRQQEFAHVVVWEPLSFSNIFHIMRRDIERRIRLSLWVFEDFSEDFLEDFRDDGIPPPSFVVPHWIWKPYDLDDTSFIWTEKKIIDSGFCSQPTCQERYLHTKAWNLECACQPSFVCDRLSASSVKMLCHQGSKHSKPWCWKCGGFPVVPSQIHKSLEACTYNGSILHTSSSLHPSEEVTSDLQRSVIDLSIMKPL